MAKTTANLSQKPKRPPTCCLVLALIEGQVFQTIALRGSHKVFIRTHQLAEQGMGDESDVYLLRDTFTH